VHASAFQPRVISVIPTQEIVVPGADAGGDTDTVTDSDTVTDADAGPSSSVHVDVWRGTGERDMG
jgi:hypothetical protein